MNWLQKHTFRIDFRDKLTDFEHEKRKWEIMGLIRAHLEGTPHFINREVAPTLVNDVIPASPEEVNSIIDEMVARGFLEQFDKDKFRYSRNPPSYPGNLI